jgi:hypothetical protein
MIRGKFTCEVDAVQFRIKDEDEIYRWLRDKGFNAEIHDGDEEDEESGPKLELHLCEDADRAVANEGDWLVCICRGCMIEIFPGEAFRELFVPVPEDK